MANVGFFPGLFGRTDWPRSGAARRPVMARTARRRPRAFFARWSIGCVLVIDLLRFRIRLRFVALTVFRLVLLRLVFVLLDPLRLLLRQRGAQLEIAGPVKERLAIDER